MGIKKTNTEENKIASVATVLILRKTDRGVCFYIYIERGRGISFPFYKNWFYVCKFQIGYVHDTESNIN